MSKLKQWGFLSAFIIPAMLVGGYYAGGYGNFATLVFVFVLIPLADWLVGGDAHNVDEAEVPALSEEKYYRWLTYLWTYLQVGLLCWAAYVVAHTPFGTGEYLGFVAGVALCTGGVGITVAHELGHKKSALERAYAQILLMTVCYMHFYIEHNKGHHVHVGTPLDPATSRRGESFYRFWWRTVSGGFASAWRIEAERLRRKNLPVLHWQNAMLWYVACPLLFCALLTLAFGEKTLWWQVPLFFGLQSVLAFSLLEVVNYIEHYGLVRRQIAPGKYERVNTLHSWNANHLISNLFLFQLQRHSDHHAYAHRRYQVLRHMEQSPQLPTGYPAMILLALVPPLWFDVMHKQLDQWQHDAATGAAA